MAAATPALVYDAHDYEASSKTADPHGHDDSCACSPRCAVCGSAKDAYIHSEEGQQAGATVVVRELAHEDAASGDEETSRGGRGRR